MSQRRTFVEINISSIPVDGWGGLGLLSIAAVIAVTLPELRLPVLVGVGGGAALAVILVVLRRFAKSSSPEPPSVLFGSVSAGERFDTPDRDASMAIERPPRLVIA